jgi:hypothetical protein
MKPVLPWMLLPLLCAFFPIRTNAQTVAAAADCRDPRLSGAQQVTCADQNMVRLTADIDALTKRLETSLTGSNKAALVDTEGPFTVQRNNCQNERPKVQECVERVLTERRNALTAAVTTPATIRSEVLNYSFLDIVFFQKYGEQLIGKRVHIWGCMMLDPGATAANRLHGVIHDSCDKSSGPSVSVFFKNMNETQASFLDSKSPSTHWEGTVERRDGKIIFSMESAK